MPEELESAPSANNLQEWECKQCKERFFVTVPAPEVVNSMTVSAIVWAHADIQCCPQCGQGYQLTVLRAKLNEVEMSWQPVQTRASSRILVPPPGLKM